MWVQNKTNNIPKGIKPCESLQETSWQGGCGMTYSGQNNSVRYAKVTFFREQIILTFEAWPE